MTEKIRKKITTQAAKAAKTHKTQLSRNYFETDAETERKTNATHKQENNAKLGKTKSSSKSKSENKKGESKSGKKKHIKKNNSPKKIAIQVTMVCNKCFTSLALKKCLLTSNIKPRHSCSGSSP